MMNKKGVRIASAVVAVLVASIWGASLWAGVGHKPVTPAAPQKEKWVLVELYTSEGCSSCPAADDLLRQLAASQSVPGVHVVAMGLHVDYWNRLGWKDVYAQKAFTQRQYDYSAHFDEGRVYTPQAIIQGATHVVGSDENALLKALGAAPALAGSIDIKPEDEGLSIHVTGLDNNATSPYDVFVAEVEQGISSAVKRGENAGQVLHHAPLARTLERLGTIDAGGTDGTFSYVPKIQNKQTKTVVFVQEAGLGPVHALGIH